MNRLKLTCLTLALFLVACGEEPLDDAASLRQAICADPDGCPGGDPNPNLPAAPVPTLVARTDTTVEVSIRVEPGLTSWALQRRVFGTTTWGNVRSVSGSLASVPAQTTLSLIDVGRLPDARYCYRFRATNGAGTSYSTERCALTRPAPGTSNPAVNRLQLRLKVADRTDAETNDRVSATLSGLPMPGANFTGLYRAPVPTTSWVYSGKGYTQLTTFVTDFARGREVVFDLGLDGIANLRDISQLTLNKIGFNALCLEKVELLVNGGVAFSRVFGTSTCKWIDGDDGYLPTFTVTMEELRASPQFTAFVSPAAVRAVPMPELKDRVEGLIGNILWGRDDVGWGKIYGPAGVEVPSFTPTSVHFDLDLEGYGTGPNPEIDVDFDLVPNFQRNEANDGWDLVFDVRNLVSQADFVWWADALAQVCRANIVAGGSGDSCLTSLEQEIKTKVSRAFSSQGRRVPGVLDADLPSICAAPSVTVDATGLTFGCVLR